MDQLEVHKVVDEHLVLERNGNLIAPQLHGAYLQVRLDLASSLCICPTPASLQVLVLGLSERGLPGFGSPARRCSGLGGRPRS